MYAIYRKPSIPCFRSEVCCYSSGSMCSDKPNVLIRAFSYRGASTQCTAVQSSLGQVMLEHAVQRQ